MTTRFATVIALVPLLAAVTLGCGNDRRVIRKETDTYRAQPAPVTGSKTTTVITEEED